MAKVLVDEKLLEEVVRITGIADETAACEFALREMIARLRKIKALKDHAGAVEFYDGFDTRDERPRDDDAAA